MSRRKEDLFSVEEMRSRKMAQASGGGDGGDLVQEGEKLSIIIHERSKPKSHSFGDGNGWKEDMFQSIDDTARKIEEEMKKLHEYQNPKIQRIPIMIRSDKTFQEHCAPRVISIGPLHHGNPNYELTEDLKLRLATRFIRDHRIDKGDLYDKVKSQVQSLKNRYDEKDDISGYDDDELTRIFLVDGCAVLHYIDYYAKRKIKELNIKKDQEAFGHLDMLMLENQLPFELLQELMRSCVPSEYISLRHSLYKFIDMNIKQIRGLDKNELATLPVPSIEQEKATPPNHILDIFRNKLIYDKYLRDICSESDSVGKNNKALATKTISEEENQNELSEPRKWCTFRNVSELKSAWIDMKPVNGHPLIDIHFKGSLFNGKLHLPSLRVDSWTAPKFLNLIAYEMCPDFQFHNEFEVTSYICFMSTLIDHRNDVKELRQSHVLRNDLGSDKLVAKLFNTINMNLVPNPAIYEEKVMREIQSHYEQEWKTDLAQLMNEYFSTPWTVLAFFGALTGLVLSFVQTWYAVKEGITKGGKH